MWMTSITQVITDYLTHILVFLGALGGSLKASIYTKEDYSFLSKMLNVALGVFCGILVAGHYQERVTPFIAGMLALAVSSVGIVILESIMTLAPSLSKRFIEWWFSKITK